MSYLTTYYCHAQAVQDAAAPLGIEACVQLSDFALRMTGGSRTALWRPRFVAQVDGRLMYTEQFSKQTAGFAGWLPYATRQWPVAVNKSAFKRQAIALGIATPMACFDPALIGGPFIIKKDASSFGESIRGPFRCHDPRVREHQLHDDEFYENFVVGHIAKAWCWGTQCVALHLHKPTVVMGDGVATLRQLVRALPNSRGDSHDWPLITRLAEYCGAGALDESPASGKETLVEFRYGSRYDRPSAGNPNLLGHIGGGPLAVQFDNAARMFAPSISPDPNERNACFTLDAMVDCAGAAWFLEMNCNPLVHPDLYHPMVRAMHRLRN